MEETKKNWMWMDSFLILFRILLYFSGLFYFYFHPEELQILKSLAQGLTNRSIAEKYFLSEGTVKNYISSIYSKLDVKDRIHAARKAQDEKLI